MACINFINQVRDKVRKHLREVSAQQGDAIGYFMDLRGNSNSDSAALANAVAEMLRSAEKDIVEDLAQSAARDGFEIVVKTKYKHPLDVREKVKQEYTGYNMAEIMERYNISKRTVNRYAGRKRNNI